MKDFEKLEIKKAATAKVKGGNGPTEDSMDV